MRHTRDEPVELALARPVRTIAEAQELPGGTAWEPKWDGMRVLALADGAATALRSRHGEDVTLAFPEVVAAVAAHVPAGTVLDGELAVRRSGRLDFAALQHRLATRRTAGYAAEHAPAEYLAFDLLRREHVDLRERPFLERRMALEELAGPWAAPLTLSPVTGDVEVAAGWFRDLAGTGVDGLVAKGLDQPYRGGARDWLKVKHRSVVDLVATAVTGPVEQPDALLLALPVDGTLVPVGRSRPVGPVAGIALGRVLAPSARTAATAGPASTVATEIAPLVVEVSADVRWSRGALVGPAQFLRARPELHPTEVHPEPAGVAGP
ncbi:ATP-dependent DNA ligase [Cellulomonas sp.]|uniref:ATP-dependent DNA ligase n=1 Tax=Cellulomonas sp. TaxID=40001 RepID=UPI002D3E93F9|nr:ATP-dependent DNA ligase [Cellulomonas sp.]HYQ76405.1 ATP-dependent DNA ligase [Cellulomonas sp.]